MVRRLEFALPEFVRVSWVSDGARATWEPRLQRILAAWLELEWRSVAEGERRCGISSLPPARIASAIGKWRERGLQHLSEENLRDNGACGRLSEREAAQSPGEPQQVSGVVVGAPEHLAAFRDAIHRNDSAAVASLLGVPSCCHELFRRAWVEDGWSDTTWAVARASASSPPAERILTVSGAFESNVLWRWMGVRAVPHFPCSTSCVPTKQIGQRYMKLGRRVGYGQEMDWIEEILSWPVEWSALHGIAEVKTPVLKLTTQTDATAEKLVVRRSGDRVPDHGAPGLAFPFRSATSPRASLSAAFRRGLEHPIAPPPSLRPWLATDNGFDSVESMMRAHQPIVGLAREVLGTRAGTVLDLGCGNGALLRQLRQVNPKLGIFGIDADCERIAHARELMPDSATNFVCGDLFDVALPGSATSTFSLVLLMPGRLIEAGPERASNLLQELDGRCERLLVYAYGDWLTRYRDLQGLVFEASGLVLEDCWSAQAGFARIDLRRLAHAPSVGQ